MNTDGGTRRHLLVMAGLSVVHFALCVYFAPPSLLDAAAPPLNDAFAVAVYRIARARLAAAGSFSLYDPQILAGQLGGLVEPFGGRALALAVLALARAGVAPVRAVALTLMAMHALFPFLGYAAARAFGLGKSSALIAFGLWSFAWFFDALVHYTWYSGRIEWAVASGVALVAAGLAFRATLGGSVLRSSTAAGAMLAVAALVAPLPSLFVAAFAVVPLAASRGLLGARRLGLGAVALVPLAISVLGSGNDGPTSAEPLAVVYRSTLLEPLWDALEVLGPGNGAPGAARTLIRTFALCGAWLQLAAFRAVGDRRSIPLGAMTIGGLVIGYAGGFAPLAWPVDPYFFLVPTFLAASLPTANLVAELRLPNLVKEGSLAFRVAFAVAAVLFVPRAVRAVATYVPELLPVRVERGALDHRVSAFVGIDETLPEPLRLSPPPPHYPGLAAFLEEHGKGRGRVVVDDAALAAYLATRTSVAVLGPIAQRGSSSSGADPTPLLDSHHDDAAIAAYLERYAAGWVVLVGPESAFDRAGADVLEPVFPLPGARARRVRSEPSWFLEGRGRIVQSGPGRLGVHAEPSTLAVLRYHHHPRLECRPSCSVRAVPIPGGSGAFIGVPNPPLDFEIVFR